MKLFSQEKMAITRFLLTDGNYFSFLFCFIESRPQQGQSAQQQPRVFFKSGRPDLSSSYASNFKNEGSSLQTIESIFQYIDLLNVQPSLLLKVFNVRFRFPIDSYDTNYHPYLHASIYTHH